MTVFTPKSVDDRLLQDTIVVNGTFDIMHFSSKMQLLTTRREHNLVVNTGKEHIAKLMAGIVATPFNFIQIGRSSEPATVEDTHLLSHYMEMAATQSYGYGYKAIFEALFTVPDGVTTVELNEAGVFSGTYGSVPEPVMLCRGTFSTLTATAGDNILVRWRDTIG